MNNRLRFVIILSLFWLSTQIYASGNNRHTSFVASSFSELTPEQQEHYHLTNNMFKQRMLMRSQKQKLENMEALLVITPDDRNLQLDIDATKKQLFLCTAALIDFERKICALAKELFK